MSEYCGTCGQRLSSVHDTIPEDNRRTLLRPVVRIRMPAFEKRPARIAVQLPAVEGIDPVVADLRDTCTDLAPARSKGIGRVTATIWAFVMVASGIGVGTVVTRLM